MHSLQKQFHEFVLTQELIRDGDHVLLAVSGGVDSMVMAELFLNDRWNFSIAHCNFNLRGQESDGDQLFVEEWARNNQIKIHSKQFDLGEGSVQLNARNARYNWFNELLKSEGYSCVATAHHLNDSLETALLNLVRGTGTKGVSGIKAKSDSIIRPLMFATREQLLNYAQDQKIKWREDSSNAKTDYDRNLLRSEVLPVLEKLNPSLAETFKNTSERLQLSTEFIQEKVEEVKAKYQVEKGSMIELKLDWVAKKTDLLILSEVLSDFGFNYVTCKEIFEAIGKSGKRFTSMDWELSMDRNSLFIKSNELKEESEQLVSSAGEYNYDWGTLAISTCSQEDVDFGGNGSVSFVDSDSLEFPLKVRKWNEGDRFQPLGMNGSKKISDYLIDNKIPLAVKNQVRVLLSRDEIVWVIGHQISDLFKITDQTQKVLRLAINASQ